MLDGFLVGLTTPHAFLHLFTLLLPSSPFPTLAISCPLPAFSGVCLSIVSSREQL